MPVFTSFIASLFFSNCQRWEYSSVEEKCQYQYKNISGHILESHILESDAGVTDKLYIIGMLSRSGHMFLQRGVWKNAQKNRAYSKKSCERAEIARSPLTKGL